MKKSTLGLILLIAVMTLPVLKVKSQWLTNGNALGAAGLLGSTNNKAYSLISNNNQRIRITANGNIQLGSNAVLNSLPTNYAQFDSDGDLQFFGTGNYLVPSNAYVFRLEDDEDMGLFFNTALSRYEFRNNAASAVFFATTGGDIHATGDLNLDGDLSVEGGHVTIGSGEEIYDAGLSMLGFEAHLVPSQNSVWDLGRDGLMWDDLLLDGNIGVGTATPFARLHIKDGTDSEPQSGGFVVLGDIQGANISMDNNEIMARNNAEVATLFFQNDGGNTQFGSDYDLLVEANGQVGIGTSNPSRELEVVHPVGAGYSNGFMISNSGFNNQDWTFYTTDSDGDLSLYQNGVYAGEFSDLDGFYSPSDARLKSNVKKMEPVLTRVMKLEPKTYNYIKSERADKIHIGFIAQEMEKQFPEIVGRAGEDQDTYVMNYSLLSVLAIKAIQEQQDLIDDQQATMEKQGEEISELKSEIASIKALLNQEGITSGSMEKNSSVEKENMLYQNQPNPFSDKTTIHVWLKEDVTNAFIRISTLQGEILSNIPVVGQGDIEINSGSLPSGSYFYSLIVDGKVIDSKRMVVLD